MARQQAPGSVTLGLRQQVESPMTPDMTPCLHIYMHTCVCITRAPTLQCFKKNIKGFGIGVWGGTDTEIVKLKSEILVTDRWLPSNLHRLNISVHMTRYLPENVVSLSKNKKVKAMFLLRRSPKTSFQMTKVCISSTHLQWKKNHLIAGPKS